MPDRPWANDARKPPGFPRPLVRPSAARLGRSARLAHPQHLDGLRGRHLAAETWGLSARNHLALAWAADKEEVSPKKPKQPGGGSYFWGRRWGGGAQKWMVLKRSQRETMEELVPNFEKNANMGCTRKIELLRRPVKVRVAPPNNMELGSPQNQNALGPRKEPRMRILFRLHALPECFWEESFHASAALRKANDFRDTTPNVHNYVQVCACYAATPHPSQRRSPERHPAPSAACGAQAAPSRDCRFYQHGCKGIGKKI